MATLQFKKKLEELNRALLKCVLMMMLQEKVSWVSVIEIQRLVD
jgi:hypothetical protein